MPICLALICPIEDFVDSSLGKLPLFEGLAGPVDPFILLGKLISWVDTSTSTFKWCLFKEPKFNGLDKSI